MDEHRLEGRRVLVVEDEYLLAADLSQALRAAGAEVIGPVASVRHAAEMVAADTGIDAAILDINLRGDMIFPVADMLAERNIPFAFVTGYDQWALPDRFSNVAWVEKPFKAPNVAAVLAPLLRVH
ncbi:response regulator [Sphingomonas radiodurans]|uniref:response regulator n=1 Tax=Sphingomonas radiodurans TaxID=2890321 RepID=UPI001E29FA54|nr:response regulator [Sphingomonas radiodurans]WBH18135.1 response regulator [Sphingomonas radiodurans]